MNPEQMALPSRQCAHRKIGGDEQSGFYGEIAIEFHQT
jgi:hypothetical protein